MNENQRCTLGAVTGCLCLIAIAFMVCTVLYFKCLQFKEQADRNRAERVMFDSQIAKVKKEIDYIDKLQSDAGYRK